MELDELMDERGGVGKRCSRQRRDREHGQHDAEQTAWMAAVAAYQRVNNRRFLRHTEYLEIAKRLGYRRESGVRGQESEG